MSQIVVEQILGRLITDDDFRKQAKESLARICQESGFQLTTHELSSLQNINFEEFSIFAEHLDKDIKRFPNIMTNA